MTWLGTTRATTVAAPRSADADRATQRGVGLQTLDQHRATLAACVDAFLLVATGSRVRPAPRIGQDVASPCSKSPAHSFRSSTFASLIVSVATLQRASVSAVRASTRSTGRSRASVRRPSGGSGTAGAVAADGALERDGDVFLPFDPGADMLRLWSERYATGSGRTGAEAARAPELLHRASRPAARRPDWAAAALRAGAGAHAFPAWPLETSLHDQYELLLRGSPGRGRARADPGSVARGRAWALVLTHDVETGKGCDARRADARPEARARATARRGTSSPSATTTPDSLVDEPQDRRVRGRACTGSTTTVVTWRRAGAARADGCPTFASYAERWGATGFRSPATHRDVGPDAAAGRSTTTPRRPTPTRSSRSAAAAARGCRSSTAAWSSCRSRSRRTTPCS